MLLEQLRQIAQTVLYYLTYRYILVHRTIGCVISPTLFAKCDELLAEKVGDIGEELGKFLNGVDL